MSVEYGKCLLEKKNVGSPSCSCFIKYIKTKDAFVIKGLDYFGSEQSENFISSVDLLRMIKVKNANMFQYEKNELDDDVFFNICITQVFFYISEKTMKDAVKQAHLRKLGRTKSMWVELKKKKNKNGGRPIGVSDVCEYNLQNYDRIVANCVRKDWYKEFIQLHKDIAKIDRSLKLSDSAIKWKFMILRYLWKVENGYEELGTDKEYEKKLKEMNEKYKLDFIFDF